MPARDLFVVTHTEARHHVEGLVGGWYDSELTAKGRADAEITAVCLLSLIDGRQAEVFSSDLLRASQTADAIATRLGVEPVLMRELREMSYGVAEGRPQDWLRERLTVPPADNRMDHRGGIENAETRREFASRIFGAISAIAERPCSTQVIVTHGFAPTFIIAAWARIPIDDLGYLDLRVSPGSITHLREDELWKSRTVVALGDASHFRSAAAP